MTHHKKVMPAPTRGTRISLDIHGYPWTSRSLLSCQNPINCNMGVGWGGVGWDGVSPDLFIFSKELEPLP